MTDPTPRPENVTLSAEEPTEDGWYAYDGGRQTMIFRLTRGQWYVTTDSGQCDPCEWGYIEQALGVWNLVSLDLAAREQARREERDAAREALARVEGAADDLDALAKSLTPCTGSQCPGCRLGAAVSRLRAALRGET